MHQNALRLPDSLAGFKWREEKERLQERGGERDEMVYGMSKETISAADVGLTCSKRICDL